MRLRLRNEGFFIPHIVCAVPSLYAA